MKQNFCDYRSGNWVEIIQHNTFVGEALSFQISDIILESTFLAFPFTASALGGFGPCQFKRRIPYIIWN